MELRAVATVCEVHAPEADLLHLPPQRLPIGCKFPVQTDSTGPHARAIASFLRSIDQIKENSHPAETADRFARP